jgi:hypothetical protein
MNYSDNYNFDHDSLHSRVNQLKQISIDIDTELQFQKKLLNEMDDNFDSVGAILKNAMGKLRHLIRTQSGAWMWILTLFVLGVVGYIYFFRYK